MFQQAAIKPLEGREPQLEVLLERWQLARDGAGQIILLGAGAGLGKTRLVEALAERTAADSRTFLLCRCSPRHEHTAFAPLVDLLGLLEAERESSQYDSSEGELEPEQRVRSTLIARLRALLSPPLVNRLTALNLSPEGRAKKTLEALLRLFLESAKRHPVILVFEDVEWADPSTRELLSMLVNRRPNVRLMVIVTFGPAFEPPWGHRAYLTQVSLPRLSEREVENLLDYVTRRQPLSAETRAEIVRRAQGAPLLVTELAQLAIERKSAWLPAEPPTSWQLEDWLTRRLEPYETARDLAAVAAVQGDELSYEQLRATSRIQDAELKEALDRLLDMKILRRTAPEMRADYVFSHPRIREAIYDSESAERRREIHLRAAEVLTESFADLVEHEPEQLAYHYTAAGAAQRAADAWLAAADLAVRSSANLEAAGRARQGLAVVTDLPKGDERRAREIALNITLGAALGTAKGYAARGAQAAYDKAVEIAWQTPASRDLFPAMQEMVSYYISRGHVTTAIEIAKRAQEPVESGTERAAEGLRGLGFAHLLKGEFEEARNHLEGSLPPGEEPMSARVHHLSRSSAATENSVAIAESLSHLALTEWFLGRPDRALEQATASLDLARRVNDPFSRVFTIYRASFLHVFRREPMATRELAHELVELSNRHGFLFFIAAGMFLEGQALTAQGRVAEGLQMMSGGLDGVWASGMEVGRPRNLALLAEACGRSQLVQQGMALIKEGLAAASLTGESHYEAELHRIEGELLRLSGDEEDEDLIAASFQRALDLARGQGSLSLELRAASSLARLWRDQGKKRRAGELLSTVYDRFTEGFDTADLRDAKALIDELG